MSYWLPGLLGVPDEPTPSTQFPSADESHILSPAEAMYSTLLQLYNHVETEKLERSVLKQMIQSLQGDFAFLQNQSELNKKPATSKHTS